MSRGSRRASVVREVLKLMREYSSKRLEYHLVKMLFGLYQGMINYSPDYLRELQSCRKRLETVRERIGEISIRFERGSLGPGKPILPEGADSLESIAQQFVNQLSGEDWLELDQQIQARVRKQYRALVNFCLEKSGQTRGMERLLLDQIRQALDARLQQSRSAVDFFRDPAREFAAQRDLCEAFDESVPELTGARFRPGDDLCMLAVPDDPAGQKFAKIALETLSENKLQIITSSDDIVFYREVQQLLPSDLPQLGAAAREAYQHITNVDQATPHSRSDVQWLPVTGQ
jgi:hypothetical protein